MCCESFKNIYEPFLKNHFKWNISLKNYNGSNSRKKRKSTKLSRGRRSSVCVSVHSRPQRPRSFWSAPGNETSGRLQHPPTPEVRNSRTLVKSDKSDWLKSTERVLFVCPEIGSAQRSRSQAQTRRIAASGDENVSLPIYHYNTKSMV